MHLLEGLVNDVKLLCLLWQLGPDVSSEEDALEVHPLALDNHPHLGGWVAGTWQVQGQTTWVGGCKYTLALTERLFL